MTTKKIGLQRQAISVWWLKFNAATPGLPPYLANQETVAAVQLAEGGDRADSHDLHWIFFAGYGAGYWAQTSTSSVGSGPGVIAPGAASSGTVPL